MRLSTENPYRDIWTAIDADNYEPGAPMGQASTEFAAINALVERLIEVAETSAYVEGRRDALEEDLELLRWGYSKLVYRSFDNMDDALMMDRINLLLQHGVRA